MIRSRLTRSRNWLLYREDAADENPSRKVTVEQPAKSGNVQENSDRVPGAGFPSTTAMSDEEGDDPASLFCKLQFNCLFLSFFLSFCVLFF